MKKSHAAAMPRFAEPWRATALRTGGIALAIGSGVGLYERQIAVIPLATLLALWFTFGGHLVEVVYRNRLGPGIGPPGLRALARLIYWAVAGSALYAGALGTRSILTARGPVPWPWWTGGVAFVAVELLIHLLMRARGQPCFYDGRG